jgi:hypothetical protein
MAPPLSSLNELVRMLADAAAGESSSGPEGLFIRVVEDLKSQDMRIPQDLEILASVVQTALQGGLVDDKKYLVRAITG